MASLVDLVGSAAIFSTGAPNSGVSVEINVSYLDAAYADVGTSPFCLDLLLFVSDNELVFLFPYARLLYYSLCSSGHFSFLPCFMFFVLYNESGLFCLWITLPLLMLMWVCLLSLLFFFFDRLCLLSLLIVCSLFRIMIGFVLCQYYPYYSSTPYTRVDTVPFFFIFCSLFL